MNKRVALITVFLLSINATLLAQIITDTIVKDSLKIETSNNLKFNHKQLIIPTVFISYGLIGLENKNLRFFKNFKNDSFNEYGKDKIDFDDVMQFVPATTALSLDFIGIKSKNSFKKRALVLATSTILIGITVKALKSYTNQLRPDASTNNSFPSGHTANSFLGAELLYQEYKDQSIWYGISGYAVATSVGVLRMYHNRHWFTDVVTGAGIGILSTKVAYWLVPKISKLFSNNKSTNNNTVFIPFYDGKTTGFGLISQF